MHNGILQNTYLHLVLKLNLFYSAGYAARHNTSPPFTANKMLHLLETACNQVTAEDWTKIVDKIKNEINSDWLRDVHFDNIIDTQIIINLNESSSSSSEYDTDDDLGCVPLCE